MYTGLKPVKRWSLRAAYVGATLATSYGLLTTEPAYAHLDVRPGVVTAGQAVDLVVELPSLRPGPNPVALEVEGEGLAVLSTRLVDAVGGDTLWTARVRADSDPGKLPLVLRAVYADGRSVEVGQALVVVPGEETVEDGFPWVAAVVGVTAATALAAAAFLLARRRA